MECLREKSPLMPGRRPMNYRICGSEAVASIGDAEFFSGYAAPIFDCEQTTYCGVSRMFSGSSLPSANRSKRRRCSLSPNPGLSVIEFVSEGGIASSADRTLPG
jgi:hypothetical protein